MYDSIQHSMYNIDTYLSYKVINNLLNYHNLVICVTIIEMIFEAFL